MELKNEDASICQQTQEPHGHDNTYRHRDQLGLGGTLLATTEETEPSNILGVCMNERIQAPSTPEPEPVAWVCRGVYSFTGHCPECQPLYTAPPKREWVGLTEYQRLKFADRFHISGESIEAIEAKLKEKNSWLT